MKQLFSPRANTVARVSLVAGVAAASLAIAAAAGLYRSPLSTGAGMAITQPVPFSHKHHVTGLGIDCRYCHGSVETSSFAGLPPTATCMNCHQQLWTRADLLEPVRASWRSGQPIHWKRVYRLPDFVYFDHSIHVAKGFGCSTCHGRIDRMPLTAKAQPLYMKWCLDCHRHPEKYVRPKKEVFDMTWQPPADQQQRGRELVAEYHIESLTNCTTCHR